MPAARTSFSELSVGQVAARSGLPVSTVHFYESQGLIASTRTAGNQRRFTRGTLRRIAFIRAAQHVGMPLAEIRSALDRLPSGRTPTARDWASLSRGWANRLDERIEQLTRLRDDLDRCIGCGCLSLGTCLLTNPYDMMSREGPGARRLLPGTPRPENPKEK
jgi:MerR family transcriptional regulator, redox-sensitive transcriptional activator SoxR